MRSSMANARVGDDGRGDDMTVKELENYAASIFKKEAGLFVPSGTMGNLICVLCHCASRGSEVILGNKSHICLYEQGGLSQIGGVHPRQLPNNSDGTIDPADILEAIREDDPHYPVTRLICLENTHNHCGGRVLSLQYMRKIRKISNNHGIPIHLDGARIMNAATHLQVSPARIAEHVDTVSFCLSKGLGAPIGSIVVGKSDFIRRCHRMRKALGGQLRQVGILAAPGLIALRDMPQEMKIDHACALELGKALNEIQGLIVDVDAIETNMVIVDVSAVCESTDEIIGALEAEGVLSAACGKGLLRLVTHHQVRWQQVEKAVSAFQAYVYGAIGEARGESNGTEKIAYDPESPVADVTCEYDPELGSVAKRMKRYVDPGNVDA